MGGFLHRRVSHNPPQRGGYAHTHFLLSPFGQRQQAVKLHEEEEAKKKSAGRGLSQWHWRIEQDCSVPNAALLALSTGCSSPKARGNPGLHGTLKEAIGWRRASETNALFGSMFAAGVLFPMVSKT
ncbi:hypothetical protein DQ04_13891010 [Trypanosoma grayi]|uniref:hypothetical protein n=1 Tax=Trypanosoma grayi TaxID=71804 RepID=UPI0004F49224|nr:hypothetical protein DQ04_13891010 [Trypanosoma grayi]KEG06445.1 hypothetical protein DQ04_13891010 [Trypanosoma grayi]